MQKGKNTYIVNASSVSQRLDVYVALSCSITRSAVQKLIRQGHVTVNGSPEKPSHSVREGDRVEVVIPDAPADILLPEDIPLDIIWEDDFIIVINKPAGMVIYPAAGNTSGTLMNALRAHCGRLATIGVPLRPGVVHRLDKDTSGLIVVAKDNSAYYDLVQQFRDRLIEKRYLLLIYGAISEDHGQIEKVIGRSMSDRKKMSVRTRRGREAITKFEVLKRFRDASLVQAHILTGRTHQIRVHFASIGHPVLGDRTYGKKTLLKIGSTTLHFPRQMLHASRLALHHPVTAERLVFEAPLPADMKHAIEELGIISK